MVQWVENTFTKQEQYTHLNHLTHLICRAYRRPQDAIFNVVASLASTSVQNVTAMVLNIIIPIGKV